MPDGQHPADTSRFYRLQVDYIGTERLLAEMRSTYNRAITGQLTAEEVNNWQRQQGQAAASPMATGGAIVTPALESAQSLVAKDIRAEMTFLESELDRMRGQMFEIDPQRAGGLFPAHARAEWERMGLLGASGPAAPPATPMMAPDGSLYLFNPASGNPMTFLGKYPEFAQRNMQVQVDRSGNLVAFDVNDPTRPPTVLMEGFGYAEVDPQIRFEAEERRFQRQLELQAASTMAQFMGLEIQRSGMMIAALGDDMANQIRLGQMVYQEADLNLNRISTALTQQRAEREQALQYGVTRSSLRTLPTGEVVTRLPFADALRSTMSQVTGRDIPIEEFELGVTAVDPAQTARQVMEGTAFTSPIPALSAGLQQTRTAIERVVNDVSAGQAAVTEAMMGNIIANMQGGQ